MLKMEFMSTIKLLVIAFTALIASQLAFAGGQAALSEVTLPKLTKTQSNLNASAGVVLADDEQLAHRVVKGSVGRWNEAIVVLTRPKGDEHIPFKGRVIVRQTNGERLILPLPPPNEPADFFYLIVESVMFRATHQSGERSLIVLYLSHKIGSSEYSHRVSVYQWNGSAFERTRTTERLLAGAKTSAEIDRRLLKLKQGKK
jgi:hypothetical protein